MPWSRRRTLFLPILRLAGFAIVLGLVAGCHSANVNAIVSNHTARPISLIQVEYPSASFGTQSLGPGQDFRYRFKVIGSGAMKITFTDIYHAEHKSTGPSLSEGSEGSLAIVVTDSGVQWEPALIVK